MYGIEKQQNKSRNTIRENIKENLILTTWLISQMLKFFVIDKANVVTLLRKMSDENNISNLLLYERILNSS